jgi:hypothetical protein
LHIEKIPKYRGFWLWSDEQKVYYIEFTEILFFWATHNPLVMGVRKSVLDMVCCYGKLEDSTKNLQRRFNLLCYTSKIYGLVCCIMHLIVGAKDFSPLPRNYIVIPKSKIPESAYSALF